MATKTKISARYGFSEPRSRRVERPRSELVDAFYEWLNGIEGPYTEDCYVEHVDYDRTKTAISQFSEIPYSEANALLIGFEPRTAEQRLAGIFISACYTKAPEDVIFFDVDVDTAVDYVGLNLDGKVLINTADAGNNFGRRSNCIVVNNQKMGGDFGRVFGTVINRGKAPGYSFERAGGVFLNFGETMDLGYKSEGLLVDYTKNSILTEFRGTGIFVNGNSFLGSDPCVLSFKKNEKLDPHDIGKIPGLGEYLRELEELSAITDVKSARRFVARYGKSGEKIKEEISAMLEGFT